MIQGLDNYVKLEPVSHTYKDTDGNEYESVSKFRSPFKKAFNKEMISSQVAKSEGRTKQSVLDEWESRTDEGTRIHNAIERFNKTAEILPEDEDLREAILDIVSQYTGYYRVYNEVVVYDEENRIAGTMDQPMQVTSSKKSVIDIVDFKTNYQGIKQKEIDKHGKLRNDYMLGCLSHLQNSKYNDYAIQLSIYAYMMEKKTGLKIGQLSIHWINPANPMQNFQIPVPYMKYEVLAMIQWKKDNATPIAHHEVVATKKQVIITQEDNWDL